MSIQYSTVKNRLLDSYFLDKYVCTSPVQGVCVHVTSPLNFMHLINRHCFT